MSAEQDHGPATPPPQSPAHDDAPYESLTDLIDRMDRAAFRRVLEHWDLTRTPRTVRDR